jgi:type IV pilus assembly protein PilW
MQRLRLIGRLRQTGLSLIELMIALAIGMVLTLAVFSILASWEGSKRVTTGLNDLEQTGNLVMFQLDELARSAGAGFSNTAVVDDSAYGCLLRAKNSAGQTLPRGDALPAPFADMIASEATAPGASGKSSDALIVMEGGAGQGGATLAMAAAPQSTKLTMKNTLGWQPDDLLLLVDASVGNTCMFSQVATAFKGDGGAATALTLGGDFYGATIDDTTLASSYSVDHGEVLPMGSPTKSPPRFLVIGVGDRNTLYSYDLLQLDGADAAQQTMAEGVFEMHALYGVDSDKDGKLDKWVSADDKSDYSRANLTAGTSAAKTLMKNIKAIRVGLILRGTYPEKTVADSSTGASIELFHDLEDSKLNFVRALSDDERLYRYRTVDSTLILRNNLLIK